MTSFLVNLYNKGLVFCKIAVYSSKKVNSMVIEHMTNM